MTFIPLTFLYKGIYLPVEKKKTYSMGEDQPQDFVLFAKSNEFVTRCIKRGCN